MSPACGPIDGSTLITVVGDKLYGGAGHPEYMCRLSAENLLGAAAEAAVAAGDTLVNATYTNTRFGDLARCVSPPLHSVSNNASKFYLKLSYAPNAQQFVSYEPSQLPPGTHSGYKAVEGNGYGVYEPALATYTKPVEGKAGQTITLGGQYFGGCHYACRFGPTFGEEEGSGEGSGADAETVEASFDHRQGSVRCRAPDRAAGSVAPTLLSLNGQQFSKVGENFTWVSPSPPPPPPPEWYDFPVEG